MIDTAKMSERGQIIIPKSIRTMIGADTDTIFAVSALDEDTVVMKKLDTDSLVKQFRALRKKTRKMSTKDIEVEINEVRKT